MRLSRLVFVRAVLAGVIAMMAVGCRSSVTSYQVKWAKRGEAIAKNETPREPAQKAAPIQQTSASPDDSAADIEIPEDDAKERRSRWGNIFGRHDKPKRVQLPRTDLIEDDEPAPKEPSFGEL